MTHKREPHRQCIGCKKVFPKKELLRFVRTGASKILFDKNGCLPGRGAYLCPDVSCFGRAIKGKRIQKVLDVPRWGEDLGAQTKKELMGEILDLLHLCDKMGYLRMDWGQKIIIKEGDVVILSEDISEKSLEPIIKKANALKAEVYQIPLQEYGRPCSGVLVLNSYPKKDRGLEALRFFSRLTSGGDSA
ncbi:MAG: YlxR family protein [Thermodesulfobacteriota bacterium]|nr:YlxR family protein [Thermodesulfobacteriota bacterium]